MATLFESSKGALFDLDGVLIDSESQYTKFWAATARKYGIENPDQYALDIKGTALSSILLRYDTSVRGQIVDELHAFEQTMDYPLYPGAIELLYTLKANGVPAVLVTSSDDTKLGYLFTRHPELAACFTGVISGSKVRHSKPHPEGYIRGAKMLGLNPGDCCVFEDSIQGLQAGRRSGAKVIAVTTSNPREKVSPLADTVVDSLQECL